jgi:hypothetical protein
MVAQEHKKIKLCQFKTQDLDLNLHDLEQGLHDLEQGLQDLEQGLDQVQVQNQQDQIDWLNISIGTMLKFKLDLQTTDVYIPETINHISIFNIETELNIMKIFCNVEYINFNNDVNYGILIVLFDIQQNEINSFIFDFEDFSNHYHILHLQTDVTTMIVVKSSEFIYNGPEQWIAYNNQYQDQQDIVAYPTTFEFSRY